VVEPNWLDVAGAKSRNKNLQRDTRRLIVGGLCFSRSFLTPNSSQKENGRSVTARSHFTFLRVSRCDEQKQLVFGTLDSEPLNDYDGQIGLGSELAVSFSQVRDHRKPTEFTSSSNEPQML
jgi:hypothetical protein